MQSALAHEQPSAFGCVMRRSLAKAIDVAVAITAAQLLAATLVNQNLRFDSLVPFFASVGWLLGVFLTVDAALAVTLGATVGEFATGLRVLTDGDRRLRSDHRCAGRGHIGLYPADQCLLARATRALRRRLSRRLPEAASAAHRVDRAAGCHRRDDRNRPCEPQGANTAVIHAAAPAHQLDGAAGTECR